MDTKIYTIEIKINVIATDGRQSFDTITKSIETYNLVTMPCIREELAEVISNAIDIYHT